MFFQLFAAPVENFHATFVEDGKVTLVWDPIENAQTIDQYEIYYKKLGNNSAPASAFEHEAVSNLSKRETDDFEKKES